MTMDAQMDRLHILGGPQGGTVSALAIAVDRSGEPLAFMGNAVGLFCARLRDGRDLMIAAACPMPRSASWPWRYRLSLPKMDG